MNNTEIFDHRDMNDRTRRSKTMVLLVLLIIASSQAFGMFSILRSRTTHALADHS